jgi:hypothetical protein
VNSYTICFEGKFSSVITFRNHHFRSFMDMLMIELKITQIIYYYYYYY